MRAAQAICSPAASKIMVIATRNVSTGRLISPPITEQGTCQNCEGRPVARLQDLGAVKTRDADSRHQGGQRQRRRLDGGGAVTEHAHHRDITGRARLAHAGEQRGDHRQAHCQRHAQSFIQSRIR